MADFVVTIYRSIDDAESCWREAERQADLHVYQSFDWLSGWYKSVGVAASLEPCLAVIRGRDDKLLMLLPLAVERSGLWRRLVWMGGEFFDYHAPVLMPGAADRLNNVEPRAILQAIRLELPNVDYAFFARQPASVGEQANPLIDDSAIRCTQAAHQTKLVGDWATYYGGKRGRRTRHNDRRKRKKLEKEGLLSFIVAEDAESIDRLLDALISQKGVYARSLGERNILEWPGYREFLRDKTIAGLEDGTILLCGLTLDDKVLGVQWGALHRRRLYSILASYDAGAYSKLSPGEFLLHDLMGWCFENGIDLFDFTYGDEPYKLAWCEQQTYLYQGITPLTVWGGVRTFPMQLTMRLRRWAKSQPWVTTAYTQTRKLVHGT